MLGRNSSGKRTEQQTVLGTGEGAGRKEGMEGMEWRE